MIGLAELLVLAVLVVGVLWVLALIDILKNEFKGNDKLLWLIVVIFLPVLGALLYYFVGRKQKVT